MTTDLEIWMPCLALAVIVCVIGFGWCAWRSYFDGPDETLARVAIEMARRS